MNLKSFLRSIEFAALYVLIPAMVYREMVPIPKIAVLLFITIACFIILWVDPGFNLNRLWYRPAIAGIQKKLAIRSGLVALTLIIITLFVRPDDLFRLPSEKPFIWGIILILYPVLSALPQELIYRTFFFHRYKKMFGTGGMMVAASAASFSFLHIIYDNYWALIITLIGGFMFARSYKETQSQYWVSVEHAIYGCLVFTIGMGHYFYEGF